MYQPQKDNSVLSLEDLLAAVGEPVSPAPEEDRASLKEELATDFEENGLLAEKKDKVGGGPSLLDDLLFSITGVSGEPSSEKRPAASAASKTIVDSKPEFEVSLNSLLDEWSLESSLLPKDDAADEAPVERSKSVRSRFADYGKTVAEVAEAEADARTAAKAVIATAVAEEEAVTEVEPDIVEVAIAAEMEDGIALGEERLEERSECVDKVAEFAIEPVEDAGREIKLAAGGVEVAGNEVPVQAALPDSEEAVCVELDGAASTAVGVAVFEKPAMPGCEDAASAAKPVDEPALSSSKFAEPAMAEPSEAVAPEDFPLGTFCSSAPQPLPSPLTELREEQAEANRQHDENGPQCEHRLNSEPAPKFSLESESRPAPSHRRGPEQSSVDSRGRGAKTPCVVSPVLAKDPEVVRTDEKKVSSRGSGAQKASRPRKSVKKQEGRNGKLKTIGVLLVAAAVACAVFAACLMSGALRLPGASDSAISTASVGEKTGSQRVQVPFEASVEPQTYQYTIEGLGNETYQVTETATFTDQGLLKQSEVSIVVPDQETGQKILRQLKEDFGDSLISGKTDGRMVLATVEIDEGIDSLTYAQLMKEIAK